MIVALHPLALRCWPWLPAVAREGRIFIGPTGQVLRIRCDGGADRVLPGGHPRGGIAAEPLGVKETPCP